MKKDFIHNLYNEKYTLIFLLAKSFLYSVSPDDAKDMVHEVFLAALQTDNLENHPNIDGWLYIGKTTVTALLRNRKYIGEYRYCDVIVPNGVPAIISKELFALAMDRLEKNRYAPSTYKADERYLLSTKLICGCCGATMVGESGTVRKADIEETIIRKTVSYIFDKEIMDGIVSRVLQWQEHENTTLPLLQKELAEIEKSLSNVYGGY